MSDVLVIGAGFAGLGTAIRLLRAGIDDVVILERGTEVGGTWRDNTYPGAACDVPSLLYSFSFAQNPSWSRAYSGSGEIFAYIRELSSSFGLDKLIRYGADVAAVTWNEASGTWTARTKDGRAFSARTVVMAHGPLANPSIPKMPGLATYEGHVVHSARWDHGYDMTGKRVGVIGTGASAVQIVPELVKSGRLARLTVFQRTAPWILPRPDYRRASWSKALYRRFPALQRAARGAIYWGHEALALGVVWNTRMTSAIEAAGRAHLRRQVKDTWMRRQLTPNFRAGCKRILLSNEYYPALQAPGSKLITWPIATLSPRGIRTADGVEHRLDCVVFATGFDVAKTGAPFAVEGTGGRTLAVDWAAGSSAYKSVSVAGYPNLFLTCGPNSGPGHNSLLVYLEAQIEYAVRGIRLILERDLHALDVTREAQEKFNRRIQRRLTTTTWSSGCTSWYLTDTGVNATMFPGFATQYTRQMARLALEDYDLS